MRRVPARLSEPGLFLILSLVWLSPVVLHPDGVPFWVGGGYTDLLISHLPNAIYLGRSLRTWGQIPFWNPMVLGGAPFLADPLSGVWYPPLWLVALVPSALAFNLLFWLHLFWAGWGSFRFMRRLGAGRVGALVAGLAFGGTPKLIGHIGLGHVGLVFAVCWTPWVLLVVRRAIEALSSAEGGVIRWAALAGGLHGVVFLIDPRWFLPLGLLTAANGAHALAHSHVAIRRSWPGLARVLVVAAAFTLTSAGGLWLPMWQFVDRTTRLGMSAGDRFALNLPVGRFLGLLVPDLGGWPESQTYLGLVVLFLAIASLVLNARGAVFWAAVVMGGWLLALGDQTPIYPLLSTLLPGASLLRVPTRFLFASAFGMAALAGMGADTLLRMGRGRVRGVRLAAFALVTFLVALTLGVIVLSLTSTLGDLADLIRPFGLASLTAVLIVTWLEFTRRRTASGKTFFLGWVILLTFDLAVVDASLLEVRPWSVTQDPIVDEIAAALSTTDPQRAFSPSYSLTQPAAAMAALELVDGIHPLQLRSLHDFMAQATGFSAQEYSVTLPPFPEGDPSVDWGVRIDAERLGLLNVGYVVASYPVDAAGLSLEHVRLGKWIYRNADVRPRGWVEVDGGAGKADWVAVERLTWTPNRITTIASGPGTLVLSELAYPGWEVVVDGVPVPLEIREGLLRGVELPDGRHEVEFVFRPVLVYLGGTLSLSALVGLIVLWKRR